MLSETSPKAAFVELVGVGSDGRGRYWSRHRQEEINEMVDFILNRAHIYSNGQNDKSGVDVILEVIAMHGYVGV